MMHDKITLFAKQEISLKKIFVCISCVEFVRIYMHCCFNTLKFTTAEKKVSELTIPFLSICKLPDELI